MKTPDLYPLLACIVSEYGALMRSQGATKNIGAIGSDLTVGEWIGGRLGGLMAKAQGIVSAGAAVLPACHVDSPQHAAYCARVEELEAEGCVTSDAQAIADLELGEIVR